MVIIITVIPLGFLIFMIISCLCGCGGNKVGDDNSLIIFFCFIHLSDSFIFCSDEISMDSVGEVSDRLSGNGHHSGKRMS